MESYDYPRSAESRMREEESFLYFLFFSSMYLSSLALLLVFIFVRFKVCYQAVLLISTFQTRASLLALYIRYALY